jgi:nucleoside-diphosphate-sugar epimerase
VPLSTIIEQISSLVGHRATIHRQPAHRADVFATWADIGKARQLLGWSPQVPIEEGLRRCAAWYLENRELAVSLELGDTCAEPVSPSQHNG